MIVFLAKSTVGRWLFRPLRERLFATFLMILAGVGAFFVGASPSWAAPQSIAVLVNDEPITHYDIQQRAALNLVNSKALRDRLSKVFKSQQTQQRWRAFLMEKRPRSREEALALQKQFVARIRRQVKRSFLKSKKLRKAVIEELIEERLRLQEAKRLNIVISEDDLDARMEAMAKRNKNKKTGKPLTRHQFETLLSKQMGINIRDFRQRMKAQLAWAKVVRRRFGHLIHVADSQVDSALARSPDGKGVKKVVLKLKKIRLAYAAGADQKTRVGRLIEAEALRLRFPGCGKMAASLKRVKNARVQHLGSKESDTLPQPLRSLLLGAKVGELTPPSLTSTGVELYAVCARNVMLGSQKKRARVKSDLRQKEFEIMSRRLMRDLRQDAVIEYR